VAPDVELHEARPVDALVVASEHADLVVVGSRGVTGIRALGSVSERVGHEARSSVLVVREPAGR
jgi:nucleotide-binding universal stress UspA family protein